MSSIINPKTERRINLAIRMAERSPRQRHRLGCVLFRKNRLVGYGWNDIQKTHPRSSHPYKKVHAEVDALLCSSCDLHGAVAYVARIRPTGIGIARPCEHCRQALMERGIRRVWWTLDYTGIGCEELDG
jgi:deoxycytidylate deaminase